MNACDMTKKTEPLVSVIIPVYCAQATLRECLDSVLTQSLTELEVICVDDGSTDESLAILHEYAAADSRVRILTQNNLFAGTARNRGMDVATGEYVAFLDADDLYFPGSLEELYCQAEQHRVDMLKTSFVYEDTATGERYENNYSCNSTVEPRKRGRVLCYDRLPEPLLSVADVPWNGLYRRRFLQENGIRFNQLRCVNDHSFFVHCLLKARRVMVSDRKTVCYRVGCQDSLVGRRAEYFGDQLESHRIVGELCRKERPQRVAAVLENEWYCLFRWYEQLRQQSAEPDTLDSQMTEYVKGMNENDVGEVFLRSFLYKERYYALRYGAEAPARAHLAKRVCDRLRRYGVRHVISRVVSSFRKG